MTTQSTVYLLDCDASLSPTIGTLLDSTGLQTYVYRSPLDFLSNVDQHAHGCLILDVRMPKMSGLQVLTELKRRNSDLSVIFLTSCQDISVAVDALKQGAVEYITKPYSEEKLLESIYAAVAFSQQQFQKSSKLREINERIQSLTKREQQILECIASGMINKVISSELHISSKTVEMHRANVMRKMQARNIAELITVFTFYKLSMSSSTVVGSA